MKRPYAIEVAGYHVGGRLQSADVFRATRNQAAARLRGLLLFAIDIATHAPESEAVGYINATVYGTDGMLGGITETKTWPVAEFESVDAVVADLLTVLDGWDWALGGVS